MLKKVGMIAVGATAALLALSPLAFAGDNSDDAGQINTVNSERDQFGLVNTNDNNTDTPTQTCGDGAVNTTGATATGEAVTGLVGEGTLANVAGDATSTAACDQGSAAGDQVGQVNER